MQLQKRFCKLKGLLGEEAQLAGVESSPQERKAEKTKQSAEKTRDLMGNSYPQTRLDAFIQSCTLS